MKPQTGSATLKVILPKTESRHPHYFLRSDYEETSSPAAPLLALVVDDDKSVRRAIKCILERRLNLKVYVASNGAEGICQARNHRFDLIVSDVNMPIMDGVMFYDWLDKNQPQVLDNFMFMTGGHDKETDIHSFRGGKVKVLDKPFSLTSFLEDCTQLLRA